MWSLACGRPLSEDNIYYLACKAFQTENLDPANFKEKHLSWTNFGKEVLTGHKFTFWEWFQSILALTQHHMQDLWKKGYVLGFVSKAKVESILRQQPPGTFLLRFSDSRIGGVSISYLKLGKSSH
jgi:signal transducer and activator of transcription 5B